MGQKESNWLWNTKIYKVRHDHGKKKERRNTGHNAGEKGS